LIKVSEGLRLKAYPDPATGRDPWTIGYGHTGQGINNRTRWTEAMADRALEKDIARHAEEVARLIEDTPTTQSEFDALVSFDFNTGALHRSTLLKKHVAEDYRGAAGQFARWVWANGRRLRGLEIRRDRERSLYLRDRNPDLASK
tara:strand:- start:1019 stop:1453 length:435 start_codon:yes stop_codon:yes gene_type:complete